MIEQHDNLQQPAKVDHSQLTAPLLYLSSAGCDWDNVNVYAYHEPTTIANWVDPAIPEITLILLTRGAMLMEQQRPDGTWHQWAVRQGDIFLKPAYTITKPTDWKSLSTEPMETVHVHLNQDLLRRTALELADKDSAQITLVRRTGFRDALLTQVGLALQQELLAPSAAGKLYAETAAQMLSVHLLRHYTHETITIHERKDKLTRQQITRIQDFVAANLRENISLETLATLIGFSPYHFARLFREATGYSPYQYVICQRIERAKYLLKQTVMPIGQIAIETGFAHQSHLTHTFKQHLGITPRAYRQQG
jgi:AraC family transcriptional regulator